MNKALDSINSLVQRYGEEVVIKIDKRIDQQQMKSRYIKPMRQEGCGANH